MNKPQLICLAIGSMALISSTVSSIYFFNRLTKLEQSVMSYHDTNTPNQLSQYQLNTINSLSSMENDYMLASESTPDDQLIYGNVDARISIHEYADIECPYCKQMAGGLKRIVDHSKGVINLHFHHFPLRRHNPVAAKESQAIECVAAAYNNRYAWMTLTQFMQYTKGNGKGVGDIPSFVSSIGLDRDTIERCVNSDRFKLKINNDYQSGVEIGVSGTPSMLIIDNATNKQLMVKNFQTEEQTLKIIMQLLNGQ